MDKARAAQSSYRVVCRGGRSVGRLASTDLTGKGHSAETRKNHRFDTGIKLGKEQSK